jgi:hypothetical protein
MASRKSGRPIQTPTDKSGDRDMPVQWGADLPDDPNDPDAAIAYDEPGQADAGPPVASRKSKSRPKEDTIYFLDRDQKYEYMLKGGKWHTRRQASFSGWRDISRIGTAVAKLETRWAQDRLTALSDATMIGGKPATEFTVSGPDSYALSEVRIDRSDLRRLLHHALND